jgi:hypothetical protein
MRMMWAVHVARLGKEWKVYRVLVGKPEVKRPFRRPRHKWENWIRMYLRDDWLGVWNEYSWLRIGAGGGFFKYGDEPSDFGATDLVSYLVTKLKKTNISHLLTPDF